MTWKNWKERVEAQGMKDDTEVVDVNVRPGYQPSVHIRPETPSIKETATIGSGWPYNEMPLTKAKSADDTLASITAEAERLMHR